MRFCHSIDLWLGKLDESLRGLEARSRTFYEGRPKRVDRVLAVGLAYFPQCVNPLLDVTRKAPDVVLGRQKRQIANLRARHVLMSASDFRRY